MIKRLFASFINLNTYRDSERLILEMYYQHVYQVAYYMLQDRNRAQDILLDTFKKAFKYMHKVQNGEKLGEWLATIATRACIDYLRETKMYSAADDVINQDLSNHNDYLSTIESMVEEKVLKNGLQKEIDKLNPDYKQAVILRYHHDMGYDEMAYALDMNAAMVDTRLHLAKLTLLMGSLEQADVRERGTFIHVKDKKMNLDRMIREALVDNMKHCPFPPLSASEAWEQLKNPMKIKCIPLFEFLLNRRNQGISASLLLILTIGLMWSLFGANPLDSSTDKGEETLALPADYYDVIPNTKKQVEQMELKEALEITDFPILVPRSLPEEFTMSQVKVIRKPQEKSTEVYLIYQGKKRSFIISELAIGEESGFGTVVNRSNTEVLEILINGQKAHLFLFKNGMSRLVWMKESHYFSIEGRLTRDEIISIAESI